jgi:quercetin dioxygenase-like cupin family protein
MTLTGITLNNSRTGVVAHVLEADEVEGRSFTLEYTVPAGAPQAFVDRHLHQHWTETFTVLSGEARYRLGRTEGGLSAGTSVTLPEGIAHLHPWNVGEAALHVRQTTTLLRPDPTAIRETVQAFAMLFWLTNQGRVDSRGRPSPLQGALILRTLQRHGGFLAGAPIPLQRLLIGTLAAIAERRGYVAFDPRCIST